MVKTATDYNTWYLLTEREKSKLFLHGFRAQKVLPEGWSNASLFRDGEEPENIFVIRQEGAILAHEAVHETLFGKSPKKDLPAPTTPPVEITDLDFAEVEARVLASMTDAMPEVVEELRKLIKLGKDCFLIIAMHRALDRSQAVLEKHGLL